MGKVVSFTEMRQTWERNKCEQRQKSRMRPGLYWHTILVFTEFSSWNAALYTVTTKIHDSEHCQHKCSYNDRPSFSIIAGNMEHIAERTTLIPDGQYLRAWYSEPLGHFPKNLLRQVLPHSSNLLWLKSDHCHLTSRKCLCIPFCRLAVVMQTQVQTDCHSCQQATKRTRISKFAGSIFVIADIARVFHVHF